MTTTSYQGWQVKGWASDAAVEVADAADVQATDLGTDSAARGHDLDAPDSLAARGHEGAPDLDATLDGSDLDADLGGSDDEADGWGLDDLPVLRDALASAFKPEGTR